MLLFTITKSSTQTHCTSNRLKASSPRAQWLGMIVAMALSGLTDKPGSKLVFNDEAMQSKEAKWYQSLVNVHDIIGDFKHLQVRVKREVELVVPGKGRTAHSLPSRLKSKSKNEMIKIRDTARQSARIIELSDGEEEDDDDIIPYAKPDSDPEDEDDDPTLVERNKPRSPVYVRDLLAGLRDLENYDRHRLALETSSALIRRKATFGKEVSDHAEELTSVLLNLNNQFELDDFLDLRQEALISLTVSQPKLVAPYIAHSCFEGSYSVQQRAAMLTALALGARELAGFRDEARSEPPKFPSKELPKHLQQIYNEQSASRLGRAADQLEQAMVEPMALNAADQISGPNALKVRTFSSRIDMQKKKVKSITSSLTKDMIQWFFIPLIGGWWAQMQNLYVCFKPTLPRLTSNYSNNRSATFSKHLLPLYLRTLAVILHASGPSTLALPQITTEFWDLLLSLRTNALNENDVKILDALLFAFLTLLELNEDKQRLADEHAKELVETQEWAKLVLSQYTSAINSDQDEGGKVKMLAAAVVVKCHEVVERWQRLMLGDLVDM
jgi:telomere length regulation protein